MYYHTDEKATVMDDNINNNHMLSYSQSLHEHDNIQNHRNHNYETPEKHNHPFKPVNNVYREEMSYDSHFYNELTHPPPSYSKYPSFNNAPYNYDQNLENVGYYQYADYPYRESNDQYMMSNGNDPHQYAKYHYFHYYAPSYNDSTVDYSDNYSHTNTNYLATSYSYENDMPYSYGNPPVHSKQNNYYNSTVPHISYNSRKIKKLKKDKHQLKSPTKKEHKPVVYKNNYIPSPKYMPQLTQYIDRDPIKEKDENFHLNKNESYDCDSNQNYQEIENYTGEANNSIEGEYTSMKDSYTDINNEKYTDFHVYEEENPYIIDRDPDMNENSFEKTPTCGAKNIEVQDDATSSVSLISTSIFDKVHEGQEFGDAQDFSTVESYIDVTNNEILDYRIKSSADDNFDYIADGSEEKFPSDIVDLDNADLQNVQDADDHTGLEAIPVRTRKGNRQPIRLPDWVDIESHGAVMTFNSKAREWIIFWLNKQLEAQNTFTLPDDSMCRNKGEIGKYMSGQRENGMRKGRDAIVFYRVFQAKKYGKAKAQELAKLYLENLKRTQKSRNSTK